MEVTAGLKVEAPEAAWKIPNAREVEAPTTCQIRCNNTLSWTACPSARCWGRCIPHPSPRWPHRRTLEVISMEALGKNQVWVQVVGNGAWKSPILVGACLNQNSLNLEIGKLNYPVRGTIESWIIQFGGPLMDFYIITVRNLEVPQRPEVNNGLQWPQMAGTQWCPALRVMKLTSLIRIVLPPHLVLPMPVNVGTRYVQSN